MFYPFMLAGLSIAAILLFFTWYNTPENKPRILLLTAGAFVILVVGLYAGINGVQLQVGEPYLNQTTELSYVWNATCNETTLELEQDVHFPAGVNQSNANYISGTVADVQTDNGVYYQIQENGGGNILQDWYFTGMHGMPVSVQLTGHYWQGIAGEGMDVLLWNFSSASFVGINGASPDVPRTATDNSYEWTIPLPIEDFINGTSPNQGMIVRFQSTEVHNISTHYWYIDVLDIPELVEGHTYVETYEIVNCTRDRYEVNYTHANYTYQYGQQGTAAAGYSQILSAVLILVGLALMLGVWDWNKSKDQPADNW